MKILTYTLLCLYLALSLANAQTDCAMFAQLIREGDKLSAEGEYKKAINKYQAAMTNCPSKMAEVQPKIAKVFDEIEQLRYKAEQAQKTAKENEQRARIAQQKASENEAQALALLEDIAARDLYQAEQSILNADWEGAYEYLRSVKTKKPSLQTQQKQHLVKLLYKELYEYPVEEWQQLASSGFFKRVNNEIVLDFFNTYPAQAPLFAQALRTAAQKPNKAEARRYLLSEMERTLGKELFEPASDLFSHTTNYPFKFNPIDFEPKPASYSEVYQPPAAREESTQSSNINYARKALELHQAKEYAQAYEAQQKAVEVDRRNYNQWFNLSFVALFVGKPQEAIEAAQTTLKLNPESYNVETNLALGYLLNNDWKEAKAIYLKWKGKKFPNDNDERACEEIFLADIADLEGAGIKHKDFKKAKKLLQ